MAARWLLELINNDNTSVDELYTAMKPQFIAGESIGSIN